MLAPAASIWSAKTAMRGERVVDASVIAAALFPEEHTTEARRFLLGTLHAEIASVAAKKVWRGETTEEIGTRACAELGALVETTPSAVLSVRAFDLAARHRFSAYDGLYLALAERRGVPVYTLDARFAPHSPSASMST